MARLLSHRWLLSIALTAAVTAAWPLLTPEQLERSASPLLAVLVLAICLPLTWPTARLLLATAGGVQVALAQINATKIAITQAPLTALDFRIAVTNPLGLWLALRWAPWTRHLAALALVIIIGGWVAVIVRPWLRPSPQDRKRQFRTRGSVGVAVAGLLTFSTALPAALALHANKNDDLWEAAGLAAYSERVGAVPFLLYSLYLERVNTGPYYTNQNAPATSPQVIRQAQAGFLSLAAAPKQLPNIVVVFAESTFDPNRAFVLDRPVSNSLFAPQPDTQLLSSLFVNAVGYGSWISEFESVVGVDSRVFGYSGFYTHSTLSPFVHRSFVTYLRAKGYDTTAYYSWPGDFYNARAAYANYGFDHFFDSRDLGLGEFGSDLDVAASVLPRLKTFQHRPAFSYIVLYENHAPHPCKHFTEGSQFEAVFAAPVEFQQNCEFNEYLRRMSSTAQAVEAVDAHLQEVERATGRPYVLVTFGDHQPHTFTHTNTQPMSIFNYDRARTQASNRETFLHIRSSAPNPFRCCGEAPPAFLMPTLMSAYTATNETDLYLPQNLAVFKRCGSEILANGHSLGVVDFHRRPALTPQRSDCREAFRSWLASIRASGPFNNSRGGAGDF